MEVLFYYDKLPLLLNSSISAPRQLAWVVKELKSARPNWNITIACPGQSDIKGVNQIVLRKLALLDKFENLKRKLLNLFNFQYAQRGAILNKGEVCKSLPDVAVFVKYSDIHYWKNKLRGASIIFWPLSMFGHGEEFSFIRALQKVDLVIIHRPQFYQDLLKRVSFHAFPAPVKFISAVSSALHQFFDVPDANEISNFRINAGIMDDNVVLFAAGGNNTQKGNRIIELALAALAPMNKVIFISTGYAENAEKALPNGVIIRHLAKVSQTDYLNWVHSADVALVPSMSDEPGPATTLEFMAAGKCIIGSLIGGNRFFLNEQNALQVSRPNDIEEWREKITIAVANGELREQLGYAAQTSARHWPDVKIWGEEWALAIDQVMVIKQAS